MATLKQHETQDKHILVNLVQSMTSLVQSTNHEEALFFA